MKDEKILQDELMTDDELDNVAGGTRAEFEDICKALGKSPIWNTRDGIRQYLAKHFNIEVVNWNTGDRGSSKNAPAEFRDLKTGGHLTFQNVIDYIDAAGKNLNPNDQTVYD
ncbi:MAG: hypothetical protein IK062_10990 [Selenomonadaceae bacterium]|nr:hypothetical protein [Selenomonadaceae bacterium]